MGGGGGLLWFGDLKGPYHFIKKVIYEAFYIHSSFLTPLKRPPSFNFHAKQKRDGVNGSTFDPNVVNGSRI